MNFPSLSEQLNIYYRQDAYLDKLKPINNTLSY